MRKGYKAVRVGGALFMQFSGILSAYPRLVSYTSFIVSGRMMKIVFSLLFRSYPTSSLEPNNWGRDRVEGTKPQHNPHIDSQHST